MSLAHVLLRHARETPDRGAIFNGPRRFATYGQWAARSAGLAMRMRAAGLAPGERILLFMRNHPRYLEVMWGAWWAGLVVVPVNAKLHCREVEWIVANSEASWGFVTSDVASHPLSGLARQIDIESGEADSLLAPVSDALAVPVTARDAGDVAWLFYTSGTTGRPKGVMITHRNLVTMGLTYFVDVDPVYLLIDPERVAEQLTDRTRAVIAVHLFGQMAPMEALADAVSGRSVVLLEDAAQAHGARRHDRPPGSVGVAAATSFYPGKNLGAYGDGGAVLTDRVEFARRVRLLSNHGATSKYNHAELGFNSRLDALQAVVLHAKLARLSTWNGARRRAAAAYGELLGHMGPIWLPEVMAGNEHVWHLYPIRLSRRDELLDALQSRGIGAGVHYPVPLHLQGAFADLGHRPGQFPNAEEAAARLLSLPLHPHLTSAQQEFIASVVTDHVA